MLTVSPALQARGIGRQLMAAAEEHARKLGASCIFMRVISVRAELIDWYLRQGYMDTGRREPFVVDARFGVPSQPLEFLVLEKRLA